MFCVSGYESNFIMELEFDFNKGYSALQRDVSAWMHLVFRVDMTQSSSADRTKLYHNGTQLTDVTDYTASTLNYDTLINYSGYPMNIGHLVLDMRI